jgi:hypothetical protein
MGFDALIINIILAIPIFFLCRFLLRKTQNNGAKQWKTWLITIVVTPVVYVGIIICWIAYTSYYPRRDFNKSKWETDVETRYEMTDDLIESRQLLSRSKDEVRQLLGEDGMDSTSVRWTYYIGFRPGLLNFDPDVLEIEFKDNKVSTCRTRGT